jgi:hypothetical protein
VRGVKPFAPTEAPIEPSPAGEADELPDPAFARDILAELAGARLGWKPCRVCGRPLHGRERRAHAGACRREWRRLCQLRRRHPGGR